MQQAPFRFRIDQQLVGAELQIMTFDLPRQLDYETLYIILSGNIAVTTAFTALKTQALYGLIKRVELIANGQTVLEQIGGYETAALQLGRTRGLPQGSTAFVTNPGVGVGTQPFSLTLPIDRAMGDMMRPKDTNLASRDLSTLQLRITIGQFADLFTGAGVATFSATTLILAASGIQEYPDPSTGKIAVPPYLLKRTQQDVPIISTNSNLLVRLPVGNLLRSVSFVQRTNGDVTTAILNNIQLIRGSDVRANSPAKIVLAETASLSNGNQFTGFSCIDFARRMQKIGKITDCWPLAGAADVSAVLDVTASGVAPTVSIVTEELIPRVARAA